MSQPRILITSLIPRAGIQMLQEKGWQVEVHPSDSGMKRTDLIKAVADVDALLCLLSENIDREIIDAAPRLKIIANYAVGYNNIDIDYARLKGIAVTNTPDVLTGATADLTWALLMAVSKRIVEADRFLRQGKFSGWQPQLMLGSEVNGKTLGIIGAGRIGQAVARRAGGFDMEIMYTGKQPKNKFEEKSGARFVTLAELLKSADYVSLHCPLTPETKHLLDEKHLRQMKKSAILINTARGPIVDEQALVRVLKDKHLAGAGLDVYEFEPTVTEELLEMNNVVLLPHIGSATTETRAEMARMCARNIIAVCEGRPALNPVL